MNPWVKRAALAALPFAIRKFQQRQAGGATKSSAGGARAKMRVPGHRRPARFPSDPRR